MSLSRANKPLASKTFDAIFARVFARYVHGEEGTGGGGGKDRKEKEKKEQKEKKKLLDAGSEALTYNRQGVDSRLLDLRQSNFANETYPVTQLASTRARTYARKLAVISYFVERR